MFIKQNLIKNNEKSNNYCDFEKNVENSCESKLNYNSHYHLGERNTTAINIMSGIKSLVCDLNGIIIAEMVYRCMICDVIYETIPEVQIHYQSKHIDQELQTHSPKHTNSSIPSKVKSGNTTNVSFFDSISLTTDSNFDNTTDSSIHTLTFDVPSGLKTLQQQFETTAKVVTPKKKTNKPFTSGNSKTKTGFNNKSKGQLTGSAIKSGFITCEICGITKFYKYTQRRFGVYSCVGCAKFYSRYLLKPVNYMCENLGKCNLKVSECEPYGRCKACLIHRCKSKFIIDQKKLTNYSKIGSILAENKSKKVSNESKIKPIFNKESNRSIKTKTLNQNLIESKSKCNLTTSKAKTESDGLTLSKTNSSIVSIKKLKSEKSNQKNTNEKNEILIKKTSNTSGTVKAPADKVLVSGKLKRIGLKSTSNEVKPIEKRTRSQSTCRKSFNSKLKNCNNCTNRLDLTNTKRKDKMRQKILQKDYCLTRTRSRNK